MSSEQTPQEELVRVIRDQQAQIFSLTDSCVRLAASNSALRNELRRTQAERDAAEQGAGS